jgi:hypothetical protein
VREKICFIEGSPDLFRFFLDFRASGRYRPLSKQENEQGFAVLVHLKKEYEYSVHVAFTTGFDVTVTVPGNTLRMPAVESRMWMVSE